MAGRVRALGRTATGSGGQTSVPYSLMEGSPQLEFKDDGDVIGRETLLMRSSDIILFHQISMPPPLLDNEVFKFFSRRRMPGFPALITRNISASPQSRDLIADPESTFAGELASDVFAHDPHMVVEVSYSLAKFGELEDDEGDNRLEHSVSVAGEFIALNPNKTDTEKESDVNDAPIKGTAAQGSDFALTDKDGNVIVNAVKRDNTDSLVPLTLPVPELQHSFRRPLVLDPPWLTIYRMLGKVNASSYTFLELSGRGAFAQNASERELVEPETFMFLGVSASRTAVLARVPIGTGFELLRLQPWKMEYQFLQKRVEEVRRNSSGEMIDANNIAVFDSDGKPKKDSDGNEILPSVRVLGHNHAYSPQEQRWVRLLRQNGDPLHEYDTSASEKGFPDIFLTNNQIRKRRGQSTLVIE